MRGNVVDGGAHRLLCGVRALAEELDVAAVARNERTGWDEDMVRVMSAVKEVQWDQPDMAMRALVGGEDVI